MTNPDERSPLFKYLDQKVAEDMAGFYSAFGLTPPDPNKPRVFSVWLVEYASDQYESGYSVMSVHATARGAYKSGLKFFQARHLEYRNPWFNGVQPSELGGAQGMKDAKEVWRAIADHPCEGESWRVRKMKVQP